MPKVDLKPSDVYVLQCMRTYGSGVTFGGAGANTAHRNAAKRMIERGFLLGSYDFVKGLTPEGKKALQNYERRVRAKERIAFRKEKRAFEG